MEVSEETAEKDACRIEHVISDETFEQMKLWLAAAEEFAQLSFEFDETAAKQSLQELEDLMKL